MPKPVIAPATASVTERDSGNALPQPGHDGIEHERQQNGDCHRYQHVPAKVKRHDCRCAEEGDGNRACQARVTGIGERRQPHRAPASRTSSCTNASLSIAGVDRTKG